MPGGQEEELDDRLEPQGGRRKISQRFLRKLRGGPARKEDGPWVGGWRSAQRPTWRQRRILLQDSES